MTKPTQNFILTLSRRRKKQKMATERMQLGGRRGGGTHPQTDGADQGGDGESFLESDGPQLAQLCRCHLRSVRRPFQRGWLQEVHQQRRCHACDECWQERALRARRRGFLFVFYFYLFFILFFFPTKRYDEVRRRHCAGTQPRFC